jgi:hypothetical protein
MKLDTPSSLTCSVAASSACPSMKSSVGGVTLVKWSVRGERRIELSALADPYAQRRFAPRSRWRLRSHPRSGYDFDNVRNLIHNDLLYNGKVAETYQTFMEARTEALVDQYWLRIESVAKALLERGVITGDIRAVFPTQKGST